MKLLNNQNLRRILLFTTIAIIILIAIFFIFSGQHFFGRGLLRQLQGQIRSFGVLSPLVVILLIILSTVIPPLPIPVPLIEIAAGLVFGFWGGFLLVWVSQIFSSLIAFELSRYFGKKFLGRILSSHIWDFYKRYLNKKGPLAVFITRTTLAAPFNIISYLAGFSQMEVRNFLVATTLGTIFESILFTFIGTRLRALHLSLTYLLTLTVILGIFGSLMAFLTIRILESKPAKS